MANVAETKRHGFKLHQQQQQEKDHHQPSRTKYILFYTKFYALDTWPMAKNFPGTLGFRQHNCPVSNCHLTSNRSLLGSVKDFDAVMFNMFHYNMHKVEGNRYTEYSIR